MSRDVSLCLRVALWCVAALLAAPGAAPAQEASTWRLKVEDAATSTRLWLQERPGGVLAFRATTVIDARLSSLAAVLLDNTRTPEWVYRAREAVLLRSDGPTRGVTQVITAMPFPLSDRESVVAWELTQDPQTLAVAVSGHSIPDVLPPHPDRVRMPLIESRWLFSPRPDGQVDVLFEGRGDPGGKLSLPLLRHFVNNAVWEGPWYTIRGLREIVRKAPFPQATLPFIHEPAR